MIALRHIVWPDGSRGDLRELLLHVFGPDSQFADIVDDRTTESHDPLATYMIEYRSFPVAVIHRFDAAVADGHEDSPEAFVGFASRDFGLYRTFIETWVESDSAQTQLVVKADVIRTDPSDWLVDVLRYLDPDLVLDGEALDFAVHAAEEWLAANPKDQCTEFRFYSAVVFDRLAVLSLTREAAQSTFFEVLGRQPDEESTLYFQTYPTVERLRADLLASAEYAARVATARKPLADKRSEAVSSPVSQTTIELAYRLFLGRDASDGDVRTLLDSQSDEAALRRMFLESPEFQSVLGGLPARPAPKERLIFIHIPKTAGTSLTAVLASRFATNEVQSVEDLAALSSLPLEARARLRYVFGHMPYGAARFLPSGFQHLTVLRRPRHRVLSYYNYIARRQEHPMHQFINSRSLTFGSFLEYCTTDERQRLEFDNSQIRRVAGFMDGAFFGLEKQVFERAVVNIFSPDMTFGLTERFDDFLTVLKSKGWLDPKSASVAENVAPQAADLDSMLASMTSRQRTIFDSFVEWDEWFYDICEAAFIDHHGTGTGRT